MSFLEYHKAFQAREARIDANRAYIDVKSDETAGKYQAAAEKYHELLTKYKENKAAGKRDGSEEGVISLIIRCHECGKKNTVSVQEQKKMWETDNDTFLWDCPPCEEWLAYQDDSE